MRGGTGDDILDGAGSDTLYGGDPSHTPGNGNDTYWFGKGDGSDTIFDYDSMAGNVDTLRVKGGVAPGDVVMTRPLSNGANNDLVLTITGTGDSVRIQDWFSGSEYRVEQVVFDDGTVWNATKLQTATIMGTVGNDTLSGGDGADRLFGGNGNDTLYGNAGNDTLDGGAGSDFLNGGAGNDTYVIDNVGDIVTENTGHGIDTAYSSISYTLGADVEKLVLTTGATSGTGNALDNLLTGNSAANTLTGGAGNDTLDGGAGADTLMGGTGDDTYVVDNAGDVVTELAGEGNDTVVSSVSFYLSSRPNLENVTLSGAANLTATGNAANNRLVGNSGANILNGGAGADLLFGGLGNDTYYVDDTGDVVTETSTLATEIDAVQSSINYTLGANLENLTLAGAGAINGVGNDLSNSIAGNAAANILDGRRGNDTLNGGAGADTLIGGTGNDTYVVGRGYGGDTVRENDATVGNLDAAQFLAGIASNQVWLRHLGNNLEVSIIGTRDKLTVENWYLGSAYHVEQFKTADGKLLLDSRVELLVQAMAAFAPPAAGQTTLPPTYQDTLAPLIAANWQ
ncbi:MAG: hypothetical protein IPI44_01365 [Sulfuritalea sp.]|nr:hypothetical protein [Sulfuritalea sp.]